MQIYQPNRKPQTDEVCRGVTRMQNWGWSKTGNALNKTLVWSILSYQDIGNFNLQNNTCIVIQSECQRPEAVTTGEFVLPHTWLIVSACFPRDRLRDTLIHEVCHAATWLISGVRDGHGRFWRFYANKAAVIHPELPVVTRCHSYEINYKFTYECGRCKATWVMFSSCMWLHFSFLTCRSPVSRNRFSEIVKQFGYPGVFQSPQNLSMGFHICETISDSFSSSSEVRTGRNVIWGSVVMREGLWEAVRET